MLYTMVTPFLQANCVISRFFYLLATNNVELIIIICEIFLDLRLFPPSLWGPRSSMHFLLYMTAYCKKGFICRQSIKVTNPPWSLLRHHHFKFTFQFLSISSLLFNPKAQYKLAYVPPKVSGTNQT